MNRYSESRGEPKLGTESTPAAQGIHGMPQTLIEVLHNAASTSHKGYTFLDDRLNPREWSFERISQEADRRARYFLSLGLKKGDRLAMIVPDGEDFVLSFFGAVRAGIVPVPMYPPLALGKIDSYIDTAGRILSAAGARMLLTNKQVAPILWSLIDKVPSMEDFIFTEKVKDHNEKSIKASLEGIEVTADDTCFLQFTSGSTSDPKGVVVTHGNLISNAHAIMYEGLTCDPNVDKGVSWLPLYHDMGLIGFVIAPILAEVPVVFIPTLSFVKRPNVWMDTIHKYRGTITFAPNFAFGLVTKRASAKKLASLDLSCLRVLGCGAEPIHADTMRSFCDKFATAGFSANALMPAYGMAEATLAMSFDDLTSPFSSVTIDRDIYEEEHRAVPYTGDDEARKLELVACGKTFKDHKVGIMGANDELLPEGEVGEIVFAGPSVSLGYFENPEATAGAIRGEWLHTGDLGFVHNGEVYVSGRQKDLIILNGRNYYPQSIEWEVEHIQGVRRGNIVAFSTTGASSEDLIIAAETKELDPEKREALAQTIRKQVHNALGVRAREVALIGAGSLPKTSSGKLQRRKTKTLYENGTLGQEGVRTLGSTATKVALARHMTVSAFARLRHEIKRPARKAKQLVTGSRRAESR